MSTMSKKRANEIEHRNYMCDQGGIGRGQNEDGRLPIGYSRLLRLAESGGSTYCAPWIRLENKKHNSAQLTALFRVSDIDNGAPSQRNKSAGSSRLR